MDTGCIVFTMTIAWTEVGWRIGRIQADLKVLKRSYSCGV